MSGGERPGLEWGNKRACTENTKQQGKVTANNKLFEEWEDSSSSSLDHRGHIGDCRCCITKASGETLKREEMRRERGWMEEEIDKEWQMDSHSHLHCFHYSSLSMHTSSLPFAFSFESSDTSWNSVVPRRFLAVQSPSRLSEMRQRVNRYYRWDGTYGKKGVGLPWQWKRDRWTGSWKEIVGVDQSASHSSSSFVYCTTSEMDSENESYKGKSLTSNTRLTQTSSMTTCLNCSLHPLMNVT